MSARFDPATLVVWERPLCPTCNKVHGDGPLIRFRWLGVDWTGQFDGTRYEGETGETLYLFARHSRDGSLSIIPVEGWKVLGYADERPRPDLA